MPAGVILRVMILIERTFVERNCDQAVATRCSLHQRKSKSDGNERASTVHRFAAILVFLAWSSLCCCHRGRHAGLGERKQ